MGRGGGLGEIGRLVMVLVVEPTDHAVGIYVA